MLYYNPNSLRPYHTTLGPAAGPTCSKILSPYCLEKYAIEIQRVLLRYVHALYACLAEMCTVQRISISESTITGHSCL